MKSLHLFLFLFSQNLLNHILTSLLHQFLLLFSRLIINVGKTLNWFSQATTFVPTFVISSRNNKCHIPRSLLNHKFLNLTRYSIIDWNAYKISIKLRRNLSWRNTVLTLKIHGNCSENFQFRWSLLDVYRKITLESHIWYNIYVHNNII